MRKLLVYLTTLAVAVVSFVSLPLSTGTAHSAGVGEYSYPEWLPLRGVHRVGCTNANGCGGGYHGYWALDIAAARTDGVYAAGSGKVTQAVKDQGANCPDDTPPFSCANGAWGNKVTIDHGSGVTTYYQHLTSVTVNVNDWVDRDTQLGIAGDSGPSTPGYVHLHFEVLHSGRRVDPVPLKACHGSSLKSYPTELGGRTSWSQVTAYQFDVRSDGTSCGGPQPGSPIGNVEVIQGGVPNFLALKGWVLDPDAPSQPTSVHVYMDNPGSPPVFLGSLTAAIPRPDVAAAFPGAGEAHGFSGAIGGVPSGVQNVSVFGINIAGGGNNERIGAAAVPIGPAASGSPIGSFDAADGRVGGSAHVRGWTLDPDAPGVSTNVHVYIDGPAGSGARGVDLGAANAPRPDVASAHPGAGELHGFEATVTGLVPGAHTLWIYAINAAGGGDNPLFGTRQVSVPGPGPIGNVEVIQGALPNFLALKGWVLDPDAPSQPTSVHVYMDNPGSPPVYLGALTAAIPRPDVAAAFPGAGEAHGFSGAIGGVPSGVQSVSVFGINIAGGGNNDRIGGAAVPIGPAGAGSPIGSFDAADGQAGGSAHIRGWTLDQDAPAVSTNVHVYIDGPAGSGAPGVNIGAANAPRPDVASAHPGAGELHGFDTTVTGLVPGAHTLWVYAINAAGSGDHPLLGTRQVSVPVGAASLAIADVSVAEGNAGTAQANFTVTRSGEVSGSSTVTWATANGTATAGVDYVAVAPTSVAFAAGETTKTVSVVVNGDTQGEADETFTVKLSDATGASILDDSGLGTITNDDAASFAVNDVTVAEGNSGTKAATFTISRSGTVAGPASVQWSTLNNSAVAPGDFVAVAPTTVNFGPGETTKTVSVTVNGDTAVEAEERFFVRLANATSATISDNSGSGIITNDDTASFAVSDVTVVEGNSGTKAATFTISRSGAVAGPASVQWSTLNNSAAAPGDFVAVAPTTVSFGPGETTKTVSVTVNGDTAVEAGERFFLRLSNAVSATIADNSGSGMITNDDAASFAVSDVTISEGNSGTKAATFTISRSGAVAGPASVQWSTLNNSAAAPGDFVAVAPTTVGFGPGETAKTVSVTVNGDTAVEAAERFFVKLSGAVSATIADNSGSGIITNDDAATFTVNDVTVTEGNSGTKAATFTISRSGAVGGPASVQWSTLDNSAVAPGDFIAVALTTVSFGPGETTKTVTVTIIGDTSVEPGERFFVRLSNATSATIADNSGSGIIANDDAGA